MQRTKKVVSLLLSVLLVFSCFTCLATVTASATGDETGNSSEFLYGDVNRDGFVKIGDATLVQRHLAEQEGFILQPGTDEFKAADVDGSNTITVDDVTTIQRYLAEFIDHFPVENIEPTTEEPTEEPTTEEPTTEEPTTEEPTTEEPAPDDTFVVAGTPAEIFGTAWDAANEDNLMTANADGTFTKEYTVTKAYDAVQLKAVRNGADWFGDETDNNVTFNLTGAGTFTVTATPAEDDKYVVSVSGDNVEFITEFVYESVFAAGNGEGTWLNDASWDSGFLSNQMTEVAEDVWEISFENVGEGFDRQIKFAIDGEWTHNFGGAIDPEVEEWSGVAFDAVYNGDNITFDTEEETQTVKAQLDLTNFDFTTKEGAKFTITIITEDEEETTVEETTEEPTTEEPTTEEPTTEEPTTEEPTTEEPTTEEPTTEEPVPADVFTVAGTPADIFGTAWDAANEDNLMTANADGTFTKEYTVTKAYDAVQLKAVRNGADWFGDETDNNVTFNLTGAGTFTVTATPAEDDKYVVSVSGDNVEFITEFVYESVFAAGNGEGTWLNDASWDSGFLSNQMTEVAEDVWEISFENVGEGFDRQIKFAIDGEWTHNFGGAFEDFDVATDAVYNGDNITFDTEDETQTVKAQLDLTGFDFTTKEGAKFTITIITEDEEETTVEETTEEPTTEEPTTEEPTTEEPTTEEPTTEEPTTEEPTTEEPVPADVFTVAGTPADIFGTAWDAANEDNLMTANADGTFTKEYTVTKAYDAVQLKAVRNGADWFGDETDNNVTFNLTGAGTFTVTATPAEDDKYVVSVSGDNVEFITEFVYESVFAAGNGEGTWLNDASWDSGFLSNQMTEVAEDVWEISFENVGEGFDRQIKFAIDGEWTHNFGGAFEDFDVATDAVYNGDNITFDTEDETQTVKAQLDLTNFDFTTKEGAKFTITIITEDEEETTVEETTEEPTTEEPTTEEPTTEEPTTEEPTTEEPTTEEPTTEEPVPADVFTVAGTPADIFGTAWDAANEDNLMTANADGTFTKEYTVTKAYDAVQLKAVRNGADWFGDETDNNVTFNLTGAGTFTVTATPAEDDKYVVSVSGDNVEFITEFVYESVFAAGNGEGTWLNDASWDSGFLSNQMTEVAEDVWEISFENVGEGFDRQIKFAIDGEWTHNFGGAFEDFDVATDAVYNGDNITFDTEDETQTVKAQLDLTGFDFTTKEGAKFTITIITEDEEETTVEETTEEPTTEEPTTEEPTTEEPTTEEPTTEEPTTEEPTTEEPVPADVFTVAGTPADIFGTAWDAANEDNLMTANADGTFTKEYTVTKAYDAVQLKAVRNGADWFGDETDNNVTFNLTGAGTFTVTATPAEDDKYVVSVSGDNVEFITEFVYESVFAAGNGEGTWLNDASWDSGFLSNQMTEVAEDVWEISFENVGEGFDRQIKFAIDGEWTHNFGGAFEDFDVATDAVYNGDNITFDTEDETQTVKAQLDLTGFDFTTKEGAKFTITIITEDEEETTVEETTEEPTTEEPTTEEPTTEEPTTEEPTTEEPTTEEPTTEEPTTEEPTTEEPAPADEFVVAGTPAEIFGTAWDATNTDNLMDAQPDGTFTKDYTVTKAYDAVQLKAVRNGADWFGDETDNNVTFNLTGAGTFTVTATPAEDDKYVVSVSGDNVEFITEFVYESVFAAGNGEGTWLNDASWDSGFLSNQMTEVAEDVWEISFENVGEGFDRQIKFAIDGEWTHNFGGAFEDFDVATDAVYNGDNITFDTEDETQTVKAQLDLTGFDFTTKEGAKFTITIITEDEEETTVEETTEEPTTEEPTTEEPTTEEPTTEEPTTEEPTTEEPTTEEPVPADVFTVAGTPADIFGTAWDAANEDNLMTANADGTFTKEYTVTKAYDAVQLKAVRNGADWFGDETDNNVTFNLTGAGTFTVTATPAEDDKYVVSVSGDNVEFITEFVYESVFAAGNGEGTWLNDASWDSGFLSNQMTEVAEDVWEISFENVGEGFDRQIKFAIDGEWTHNFGGAFEDFDVATDAVYNGDNITFDTEDETQTVKAQLDLTGFDFTTKEGAKFTITIITEDEEETTVEETTEEPTTEEPTTEEPTTEEPTTEEPTTEEPTTEEPTTEEPTTEEPTTEEPAPADEFVVAGTPAEIFGTAWDATNTDNLMDAQPDGTFTKDYTVTKAYDAVQLKAVRNGADWFGDETDNNVTFNLTGAGTFTVTATPAEDDKYVVSVSGDNVEFITDFEYDTVYAVGNGEGTWLNDASWDPGFAANEMKQIADDVWQIRFDNIGEAFDRQVKFAIDGTWTHNFGGAFDAEAEGEFQDAVYNGDNITFDTEEEGMSVVITLDLTEFDFATKTGAKFNIDFVWTDEL